MDNPGKKCNHGRLLGSHPTPRKVIPPGLEEEEAEEAGLLERPWGCLSLSRLA